MRDPCLTIVIPTYEPHFGVVRTLIGSIDEHVRDPESLIVTLVVEEENSGFVSRLAGKFPRLDIRCRSTEQVYIDLDIDADPADFLRKAGKFTFQSIKKIGGILAAETDWVLVLDSESVFLKPFSAKNLLNSYAQKKYVFYSKVEDRGLGWKGSLSELVTVNAAFLVGGDTSRWYMEYYHWFYERRLWQKLIDQIKRDGGFDRIIDQELPAGIFENVLFYQFVQASGAPGYQLLDIVDTLQTFLPPAIFSRIDSALKGRLEIVGLAEYLSSLVSVDEVEHLRPFFDAFDLPFFRLEPYTVDPDLVQAFAALPSVCAFTSSHRLRIMSKPVAVCVSGEFRSVFANIQAIRSFTTGVKCDIYVHVWTNDGVPAVKDALQPFFMLSDTRPVVDDLVASITKPEPYAKEGRDAGSIYMFEGIKRCFEAMEPQADRYGFVVRLRPDMLFQQSLRELLLDIANDEQYQENTIYIPNGFHSQGINDQFAIGSCAAMLRYGAALDYVEQQAAIDYFNPEHLMAGHLLDAGVQLKTLPMTYVLLRNEAPNLDRVAHMLHVQNHTWWSAPLPGPWKMRVANGMFAAKQRAARFMQARDQFGDWELVVGAELLLPESRSAWKNPLLRIKVRRDHKNPDVFLTVDEVTDGVREERYVEVSEQGLRLVHDKPPGILFVHDHGERDVRLTRFLDDLDVPVADIVLPAYGPVRDPAGARCSDDPATRVLAQPAAAVDAPGPAGVLERMLLPPDGAHSPSAINAARAKLLLRRARQARRRGDLATAGKLYGRMLTLDPGRAREWVQYGHVIKDQGDWKAALAAYRTALHLDPGNADASFHYAAAHEHLAAT